MIELNIWLHSKILFNIKIIFLLLFSTFAVSPEYQIGGPCHLLRFCSSNLIFSCILFISCSFCLTLLSFSSFSLKEFYFKNGLFDEGWAVLDTLGSLIYSFIHSTKWRTCAPGVSTYMVVHVPLESIWSKWKF